MPIFDPKTLYYESKTSIGCPSFFRFHMKKSLLLCPYFVSRTSILKKQPALMSIFCQKKHRFSKKDSAFISFFSICHEIPPAVIPICNKKYCQFCQNYTILRDKMVNRMQLISYFLQKNHRFHAHIM